MSQKRPIYLKMVNVGFDGAGKTSMYSTFVRKKFLVDYIPTVFESYVGDFVIDKKSVSLAFWDTCCGENDEYKSLRPLSYCDTDVFTLCFDVSSLELFPDMKTFWVEELRSFDPNIPIILVATKTDLRGGVCKTIRREEGVALAEEIVAAGYFEISSLKMEGLDELFHSICVVGMKYRKDLKRKCLII